MLQHAETLLPMAGEIQAELNCHTAGVSDSHAWGLMLPSSSRVSPVTYHSVVASKIPGPVPSDGQPMGVRQFRIWGHSRTTTRLSICTVGCWCKNQRTCGSWPRHIVSHVIADFEGSTGFSNGLFVMTTATDHKNNLNRSTIKKTFSRTLRVETTANSAGGTAAVARVAQPSTGFLNGHFYSWRIPDRRHRRLLRANYCRFKKVRTVRHLCLTAPSRCNGHPIGIF